MQASTSLGPALTNADPINGHPPRPFLFDTGSTSNGISVEIAEQLGLKLLDHKVVAKIGQTETRQRIYYAETVQIGQTVFEHVSFQAHEPGTMTRAKPTQLLGFHLFEKTPFTIDLSIAQLSIFKRTPELTNWTPLQINELQLPEVEVIFIDSKDGTSVLKFPALIDTGAKGGGGYPSIIMPRNVPASDRRIRPLLEGDGKPTAFETAVSTSRYTYYPAAVDLRFGPIETTGKLLLFFENEGSFAFQGRGILELAMFRNASLTFDIRNKRWAVDYHEIGATESSIR